MDLLIQNSASDSYELSALFIEISRDLLNETYALEHHFRALSLTEIGLILEEGSLSGTLDPESYERCKSHYCMLLIELELAGYECLPETLSSNCLDVLVQPKTPEVAPEIAEEHPSPESSPNLSLPPPLLKTTAPEIHEETIIAHLEEVALPNSFELLEVPIENATVLIEPEPEEIIELTSQHGPLSISEPELNLPSLFESLKDQLTHSLSKNYLQLASQFSHSIESGDSTISLAVNRKLVGQFLCSLLEVETLNSIKPQIRSFWPHRKEAIAELILETSFSLKPELIKHLNKYSEQYSDWLYEGRFPIASITHCLRFVLLTEEADKFKPSCLELSALIYLFGQEPPDEKSNAVKNLLELNSLPDKEPIELCFRLSRLEFLKAKALDHYSDFDNDHIELIKEDVFRVLELIRKMYPIEKDDLFMETDDIQDVA